MAGESGKQEISHGIHYEEHHGTMATLAFGQELQFVAGSEMKVLAGLESNFVVGAENKIGIATNTILELGAEVKYVRGWAVEIAHEGGGAFEQAFTASAGSSKMGAFTTLKVFMGLTMLSQIAAVATMLSLIKTTYVENGKLIPSGESGAKMTISICQNISGVLMFVSTAVLNLVINKFLHIEPLAAMTVNHESQAFIGARGSVTHPGTGGLEMGPNLFKLSASSANRDFSTSGHEVVGYSTEAGTKIEGNQDMVTIQSSQLRLQATATPATILFNKDLMNAYIGDFAGPLASLKMGKIPLVAPGQAAPSDVQGIRLATKEGAAVSVSGEWVRVSADDGAMLEIQKGQQARLTYAKSGAEVILKQAEATLSFGTNEVKVSAAGVSIAGALTVLSPAPMIPGMLDIAAVKAEILGVYATELASKVKLIAEEKTAEAITQVMTTISDVKRGLETKISQATTKAGSA